MSLTTPEIELEPSDNQKSRRALLMALGVGAAVGAARSASAQSEAIGAMPANALRMRLLRRITYGPTPADVALIKSKGYDAYLDYQLDYTVIDDSACENAVAWYSTVFFSERDLFKVREDVAKQELSAATMLRAIKSKRQLYQRMVEFWTDHFNILFDKAGVLKVVHDRDVIRKYALGNFKEMLMASTKSPANLVYLDNEPSSKEAPNQNLARELMELHSIGVNGGYTQADVINVAKCLTGWTVTLWPWDAPDIGIFHFDKKMHSGGTKLVLGNVLTTGGITDGEQVVQILANSRATGVNLAKKLCRFFLGYEPTQALVDEIADIYMSTNGEIKPMVKAVLSQTNVANAPLLLKRPFHYAMGILRQSEAEITSIYTLRELMYMMGQHPFEWSPPNGYPFAQTYWSPGLLPRWNFALSFFKGDIPTLRTYKTKLVKTAVLTEEVLDRINDVLFQGELSPANKDLMRGVLGGDDTALNRAMLGFGMAATLPGYQKC